MTPPRSGSQGRTYAEAMKGDAAARLGQWPRSPRRVSGAPQVAGSPQNRGPKRCLSMPTGLKLDHDLVDAESEGTTISEPSVNESPPAYSPLRSPAQKRAFALLKGHSQCKDLYEDAVAFVPAPSAAREAPTPPQGPPQGSPTSANRKCQSAGAGASPLIKQRSSAVPAVRPGTSPPVTPPPAASPGGSPKETTPRRSGSAVAAAADKRRSSAGPPGGFALTPPGTPKAKSPLQSDNILWEDRRRAERRSSGTSGDSAGSGTSSTTASSGDTGSLQLVAPRASDDSGSGPTQSLGALQSEGRDQVMSQWMEGGDPKACTAAGATCGAGAQRRNRSSSTGSNTATKRSSVQKRENIVAPAEEAVSQSASKQLSEMITSLRTSLVVKSGKSKADSPRLEWSSLSVKARKALQQWHTGQIGGRHCLMLLEYDAAIAFFISPLDNDEVQVSDLRGGIALSALSGLSSEVRGGWDNGWLHSEVFEKSPSQVLEDAVRSALEDSAAALARGERPDSPTNSARRRSSTEAPVALSGDRSFPSADQVNLALRRRAMQAQGDGMRSLMGKRKSKGPRCSEEYLRAQVWLELVRMHVEGPSPEQLAAQEAQVARNSKDAGQRRSASMGRTNSVSGPQAAPMWDDHKVIAELRKKEAEIETESKAMTLDALRNQNRSIEAYLMRLVRQRDQLKHIARLAEECDSYLILGLDGPHATDEEVKRAYHTLARKEHPDKAGVSNKERFQDIQQAYTAVTKRRKSMRTLADEGAEMTSQKSSTPRARSRSRADKLGEEEPSTLIREVASRSELAREAAETITTFAHDAFAMRTKGVEARGMQKRAALRELQTLTRKSILQLRQGAFHLRSINECAQSVADGAQRALIEYGEWAETAMAGAGLKERADVVLQAGQSCVATAEQLEKMAENDQATLHSIERVTCEVDISSGCRVLSDSLIRTATVVRCAADEAIGAATTALELGCSLAVLDRQQRQDMAEKEAERRAQQCDEEAMRPNQASSTDLAAQTDPKSDAAKKAEEDEKDKDKPKKKDEDKADKDKKDEDKEKNPLTATGGSREEVKTRQASLRSRHLQCLASLNDEVLALQEKLKKLMERSEGLMPSVHTTQKGSVFDLVGQLLQNSLSEAAKLATDASVPSRQVLERCFAYALVLEHASAIALPSEVKTQALKLAAIIDLDLLCQIVEGPFKRRLLSLEKCRPASLRDKERVSQLHLDFSEFIRDPSKSSKENGKRPSSHGPGSARGSPSGGQAWAEAVHFLCARIVEGLRKPLQGSETAGAANDDSKSAREGDPFVHGVFY